MLPCERMASRMACRIISYLERLMLTPCLPSSGCKVMIFSSSMFTSIKVYHNQLKDIDLTLREFPPFAARRRSGRYPDLPRRLSAGQIRPLSRQRLENHRFYECLKQSIVVG